MLHLEAMMAGSEMAAGRVLHILARNWWAVALRGAVAVIFGVLAVALPGIAIFWLAVLFAAYMLIDGVFAIVAGVRAAQHHARWWPFALEGVADNETDKNLAGLRANGVPGVFSVRNNLVVSSDSK